MKQCYGHLCFRKCVGLQDPYCAWDKHNRKCVHLGKHAGHLGGGDGSSKTDRYVQNVRDGKSPECPKGEVGLSMPAMALPADGAGLADRGLVYTSLGGPDSGFGGGPGNRHINF
jgi:hypothetical protein